MEVHCKVTCLVTGPLVRSVKNLFGQGTACSDRHQPNAVVSNIMFSNSEVIINAEINRGSKFTLHNVRVKWNCDVGQVIMLTVKMPDVK